MSADLNRAQMDMLTSEFLERLTKLTVSRTYADDLQIIHQLFRKAASDGFGKSHSFGFKMLLHFHQVIPIFTQILSTEDRTDRNFQETKAFLESIVNTFENFCLLEIFLRVKDIKEIEKIFRSYVVLLDPSHLNDNADYDCLTACLIPIIGMSSLLIPVKEEDLPDQLLTHLLTFAKRYWRSSEREKVMRCILAMIKVFSKKPALVSLILANGWPNACVEWLTMKVDGRPVQRPSYEIDHLICLILQKLARHNSAIETLNQLNCVQAFEKCKEQMKKDHTEREFNCLHFVHCMIYTLLVQADEIKQMSVQTDEALNAAVQKMVQYVLEASRTECMTYRCFHISEILSVLSKLFINDDILTNCLNENGALLDCLCQLMTHFATLYMDTTRTHQVTDDEMLLTVSNLLWSISFHSAYQEKFQSNTMLMHTLANLASSATLNQSAQSKSMPRDLCSLKKAVEGIIWNLKKPTTTVTEKVAKSPLAMISYSHSDATFCRQLVESLSAHVPVWVDYKQANDTIAHSDDLWEEIARAMEMATVIILIVSKEYYDSKSCRQELSYATDALRKRIIPIYAPYQQYRASGWLGIRIAGQKYIHFGRKLFNDAINELAGMILNDQKPIITTHSAPLIPIPSSSSTADETNSSAKATAEEQKLLTLKDWTKTDIQKWFQDNHIHSNLVQLYADLFPTGTSLIVYARHLKCFYRNEYVRIYNKYYEQFNGKRMDTNDFVTFVDALYRLRLDYDPNGQKEDQFDLKHLSTPLKALTNDMTWL